MLFTRKNTVKQINKQIQRTSKAFRAFSKIKDKLEKSNEELSLTIQESIKKENAYKTAAKIESDLQEIALERISENMESINRIKQLTGEK